MKKNILRDRKTNSGKKRISRYVFLFSILILLILPLLPNASAGGQDATFDSVELKAVPLIQGVGGEIQIESTANFFGGCCYHLFAFDVKAELKVPDSVRIVSDPPKTISEVDAAPGGKATSIKFDWKVVGDAPGIYDLEVVVSSSNCGTLNKTYQITVVKGVSVSVIKTHPKVVSVEDKLTFLVDIKSGNDFVEIENTELYIWRSDKNYDQPELDLKAEENKIYEILSRYTEQYINLNDTNTPDINDSEVKEDLKLLGTGSVYTMAHIDYTETWRIRLDEFKEEEIIYYWVNVETSDGKNLTSSIFKQDVEDLEKKYNMVNQTIWITALIIIIGFILILGISWAYYGRVTKTGDKSGIYVLGGTTYTKPTWGTRLNISGSNLNKFRTLVLLVFIALFIILIILSFIYGLFEELISVTGG
jgi:hypothetical protein